MPTRTRYTFRQGFALTWPFLLISQAGWIVALLGHLYGWSPFLIGGGCFVGGVVNFAGIVYLAHLRTRDERRSTTTTP